MHRKLAAHATVDFHGIGNEDIFYGKAVPELRQVTIALSKDERLKQSGLDGGQLLTVRVRFGSKPAVSPLARHVRSTLESRHRQAAPAYPFDARNRHTHLFHGLRQHE